MSHYFDEVLTRGFGHASPKTGRQHVRRSSTARSIGARSDFIDTSSVNGDHQEVRSAVAETDPDREAEIEEANNHMHQYITDQLERVRTTQEHDHFVDQDEFETRAST